MSRWGRISLVLLSKGKCISHMLLITVAHDLLHLINRCSSLCIRRTLVLESKLLQIADTFLQRIILLQFPGLSLLSFISEWRSTRPLIELFGRLLVHHDMLIESGATPIFIVDAWSLSVREVVSCLNSWLMRTRTLGRHTCLPVWRGCYMII